LTPRTDASSQTMRLKSSLPETRSAFQLRASATSTIERATEGLLVSVASRKVDSVKATREVSPRKRYSVRPIVTSPTVTGARLMM
jgi:hypothetical protein